MACVPRDGSSGDDRLASTESLFKVGEREIGEMLDAEEEETKIFGRALRQLNATKQMRMVPGNHLADAVVIEAVAPLELLHWLGML